MLFRSPQYTKYFGLGIMNTRRVKGIRIVNTFGGGWARSMKERWSMMTSAFVVVSIMLAFGVVSHASWQNSNSSVTSNSPSAAAIYARRCASCHGKDGRAKTFKAKFNDARDLTNWQWQEMVSDERIYNSIVNGRGKMPAFGKKLSDSQVDSVVSYVRSLKKQ
jgi:mono/diheme cytochrome c family protein